MAILGRTNIDAFPLGFGGLPLMNISREEASKVIRACLDGGINFADTATGYGDSEEMLSMALEVDRESFYIATKSMNRSAKGMAKMIDQSLMRMKTDYIDIYQIHAIGSKQELDEVMSPGGAMEALRQAREAGKVRFIGVTGHQPDVLVDAIGTGEFDTVMAPINVVDRESEEKLLPMAKELNIGIMAMKPVCGGTLDNPLLGIRYSLNSLADIVLCGMKNEAEVESNLQIARNFEPLTEAEEEQLLAEASQMGNQFCRRCGYCQPCPQGINIPRILWLANVHRRGDVYWPEAEYAVMKENADYCEKCGECEAICPYELPTMEMLEAAHAELKPSTRLRARRRLAKALLRVRTFGKSS